MLASIVTKRPQAEDLSGYVQRVLNEKGLNGQQVEDASRRAGRPINRSYISKIISRSAENLTVETLRSLALGLGEPLDDVMSAALNIGAEKRMGREILLRQSTWDALDSDAARCKRTSEEHLEAILKSYFNIGIVDLRDIHHLRSLPIFERERLLETLNEYWRRVDKTNSDTPAPPHNQPRDNRPNAVVGIEEANLRDAAKEKKKRGQK